jgi:hypothetical protein
MARTWRGLCPAVDCDGLIMMMIMMMMMMMMIVCNVFAGFYLIS